MENNVIDFDYIEDRFKRKYFISVFTIVVLIILISSLTIKINSFLFFIVGLILCSPYIPNYLLLKKIKCPYCRKGYFTPKACDKKEIEQLVKSDHSCINCGQKAIIVSEKISI